MIQDSEKIRHHIQNLIMINRADKEFKEKGGHITHYQRPGQKTLVVIVRQTDITKIEDISNITHIALAGLPNLPRLFSTFNQIREIKEKYPGFKIDIAGWSAGGLEAQLFSAMCNNAYGYNPGTTVNHLTNNRMYPNLEIIKTETDFVSAYPTLGANITTLDSPFLQHNLNSILEYSVNEQLAKYQIQGDLISFHRLKNKYQDYIEVRDNKGITQQKKMELLEKLFPTLRDEVERTNQSLAKLEYAYREKEEQKEQAMVQMRELGLGEGETYYNQHYVKYWRGRSPAQDVHEIANYLEQYLPQDKNVRIAYKLAMNIFTKSVMTGKSWDQAFRFDKIDIAAMENFMQVIVPHFLPKQLNEVVQKGQMARKFVEDSIRIYALSQKSILSLAMKAEITHLGMSIANTIISLLPLPKQVKSAFSLASSLAYMTFLLVSGGPIVPIVLAALAILSSLGDLGVGCNKGKDKNEDGSSRGNNGKGNAGGDGGGGDKSQNNPKPQNQQSKNKATNNQKDFFDLFNSMVNDNPQNSNAEGNGQGNGQGKGKGEGKAEHNQRQQNPRKQNNDDAKPKQAPQRQNQKPDTKEPSSHQKEDRTNKQKLPTLDHVPLQKDEPLQKPDSADSQRQEYNKFIRNFAKKLFRGNQLMSAQEISQQQSEEDAQRQKQNSKEKSLPEGFQPIQQDDGWEDNDLERQPDLGGRGEDKNEKKNGGGGEQKKKNNKKTQKETLQTSVWISDFTKNNHEGKKQHQNQDKEFQKTEDKSDMIVQKQTIGTNKGMKKKIKIIDFVDILPDKVFDSKDKQKQNDSIPGGKYFTKERLKQFDAKKYKKAGRYVKGNDEIMTGLRKQEAEKGGKKNKNTLVKFKNINMNKQSGKVKDYEGSEKRVLIPDSFFTEERSEKPELIREKSSGEISKGVINPNSKGNYTINTYDFFNSLQVDTTSAIQLALPSEMLYLTENDLDILFFKRYFENSLLGYERIEQSIQKQQEDNRKKAGLAHLSHEELRYKILGDRQEYDEYTTGGTYQIISSDQIPVDTDKTYTLSGQFRTKHSMRLMIGFICYDSKRQLIPGYQVFKRGEYVKFKSFNKAKQQIQVEGNLNGWNSYPRDKKLKDRFLGFFIEGDTSKNPDFTIVCDNDPNLESPQESGFVSVDPAKGIITLSKYALNFVPKGLKAGVSLVSNQIYESQSPTLICVDIKNIDPSLAYTEIEVEINGQGREKPNIWKKNSACKSKFWPQTAYVQVAIYTNWFGNQKRQEKGELIWKSIHLSPKQ